MRVRGRQHLHNRGPITDRHRRWLKPHHVADLGSRATSGQAKLGEYVSAIELANNEQAHDKHLGVPGVHHADQFAGVIEEPIRFARIERSD